MGARGLARLVVVVSLFAIGCGHGRDVAADGGATVDASVPCTGDGECDDSNSCTADHCVSGVCRHAADREDEPCNDGQFCTEVDLCASGRCVGQPRDCSAVGDFCNTGACDEAAGACVAVPRPDDTPCDDGQFCTVSDRCAAGVCAGDPRDCSAVADACNDGICDEAGSACVPSAMADGTPCDDGVFCTGNDVCGSGTCEGGPIRTCADGNACTLDACDLGLDACSHTPVPPIPGAEGPPGDPTCADGLDNDCDGAVDTADAQCVDCLTAADCDDGNPCTADACSGTKCQNTPLSGTACDDGRFCTVGEQCVAGLCQGASPRACADGDACTDDACDEAIDQCLHPGRQIDQGSLVATSSDDGTVGSVCLVAGSQARVVAWTELRDTLGLPIAGATVTIGGAAATESATQPGTYFRELVAAAAPATQLVSVSASACGNVTVLSHTILVTHAAGNTGAGGLDGCNPPGGNLRVRVVEAETGNAIAGARLLVGMAQGSPFEHAAGARFGGASSPASNLATTDGAGYATFFDYGGTLDGPVTVTAAASGRANFTIVAGAASDLVLPLPALHPTIATTIYGGGTGTATISNCNDVDVGLLLPKLDLGFFSALDLTHFFSAKRCWDPMNGAVGQSAVPANLWLPGQRLGFLCAIPGMVAEGTWSLALTNGQSENLSLNHIRLPLAAVQSTLAGGGAFTDLLAQTSYVGLGFDLAESVPTAPTSGRSLAASSTYDTTFTITYAGQPATSDVAGFALGDYQGSNGTGDLFMLGHKVHAFTAPGSSVAIPNSKLDGAGAPAGVRRLASISALYLDPTAHPSVASNRLEGVSTVLVRQAAGGGAPFGAAGGAASVTSFLDLPGLTFVAPGELRWSNVSQNGVFPSYSRHELSLRTARYLPVLACATTNDVRLEDSVQWVVLRPFDASCAGEECFSLPTLPASFPRSSTASQKRSGFEARVGSGLACTGACAAGETCVDPDGGGAATAMCMGGSGTSLDPYFIQTYSWHLRVFHLGLAPSGWSFGHFDLGDQPSYLSEEASNRATFE